MRFLLVTLVCLLVVSCGATKNVEYFDDGYSNKEFSDTFMGQPIRVGTTAKGKIYTIRNDGQIVIYQGSRRGQAAWVSYCEEDQLTDKLTCYYRNQVGESWLLAERTNAGNMTAICVIGHDFPHRKMSLRVDDHKALSSNSDSACIYGKKAKAFEAQLMNGQKIISRRYEWPYDFPVDQTIEDSGQYSEIKALTQFVASNLDRLF